jgi:hypothetical protein
MWILVDCDYSSMFFSKIDILRKNLQLSKLMGEENLQEIKKKLVMKMFRNV